MKLWEVIKILTEDPGNNRVFETTIHECVRRLSMDRGHLLYGHRFLLLEVLFNNETIFDDLGYIGGLDCDWHEVKGEQNVLL